MMSVIDENFARIFLQATPLREAVNATIDLEDFSKRISQLQRYSSAVFDDILSDSEADLQFLGKEVTWGVQQCDKYLKLLVPTNNGAVDNLKIINAKTVLQLVMNYRQVLTKMLDRLKQMVA